MSDHNKPDLPPQYRKWLIAGGIYLSFLLAVVAIEPMAGLALYLFSALVVFIALIIYIIQQGRLPLSPRRKATFADRLRTRLSDAERREDKFRDEANAILKNIRGLEDNLSKNINPSAEDRQRAENVVGALQAEFDLRHTKALFFADCATRLRQLLDRHQLNESIKAGEAQLVQLQSTNFDDEATVEEARHHLEQDSVQLEALAEISRGVEHYFDTTQAEELRVRLEHLRSKILQQTQAGGAEKS